MDKLDYPDKMVIDLDPPPGGFEPARKVARQLAEIYKEVGLVPYLMITGSKGLHVVAPLDRKSDFTTVRAFARDLVEWIAEKDPEHLTINARDHRKTRMFLDYLRNAYSATAVAPYSVRARPGAPVATPLEWDELGDKKLKSDKYNIKNISRRLARKGDVMKDMMKDAGSVKDARVRLDSLIGGTKAGATKARK
jgi:bifunctional non-homologous end joining protein LigD